MAKKAPQLIALLANGKEGQAFDIQGELTIGREKTCDIRVKVPSISRQHAKISLEANGLLTFVHLSSVNPSLVNGEVVRGSLPLKHQDILTFGDALFQVKWVDVGGSNVQQADRKSLPTPIKRAIQAKQPKGTPKTPKATPKKAAAKVLPSALRAAINNRADRSASSAVQGSQQVQHIRFDSNSAVKSIDYSPARVVKKKSFLEELKSAMAARNTSSEVQASPAKPAPVAARSVLASTSTTPLKNAIKARLLQLQAEISSTSSEKKLPSPEKAPAPKEEHPEPRHRLLSPIRRAIALRRGSPEEVQRGKPSTTPLRKEKEVRRGMPTPLRRAIHLRKSLSPEDVQVQSAKKRAFASPVGSSKKQRRGSSAPEEVQADAGAVDVGSAEDVPAAEKEEVEGAEAVHEEVLAIQQADTAEEVEAALQEDALFAAQLQISKEVMLMMEDVYPEQSEDLLSDYGHAMLLMATPRRLSTKPGGRRRESLLGSLEKKGSHAEAEGAVDLIASLTDADMAVIEEYAAKLPSGLGLDDTEAFALALDAYIRGVEQAMALKQSKEEEKEKEGEEAAIEGPGTPLRSPAPVLAPAVSAATPVAAAATPAPLPIHEQVPVSVAVADASSEVFPLNDLFALPLSYLDALSTQMDEQLVDLYAQEILAMTNVSEAVAFGVALDTFLADPVLFRHRIGKLAMPEHKPPAYVKENKKRRRASDGEGEAAEVEGEAPSSAPRKKRTKAEVSTPTPKKRGKAAATPVSAASNGAEVPLPLVTPTPRKRGRPSNAELAARAAAAAAASALLALTPGVTPIAPPTPAAFVASTADPTPVKAEEQEEEAVEVNSSAAIPVPSPAAAIAPVTTSTPVKKGRGGRIPKAAASAEKGKKPVSPAPAVVPAKKGRGGNRGGRKAKEAAVPAVAVQEEEEEEALAIICDGCEEEYLVEDIGLTVIPEGDWICAVCIKKRQAAEEAAVAAQTNRRGGRGKKQEEVVPPAAPAPVPVPAVTPKKSRGRPPASAKASPSPVAAPVPVVAAPKSAAKGKRGGPRKKGQKVVEEPEEEEALAIICDGCDAEYLVDEVGLTTIPEGDWFCVACAKKKIRTPKVTTRRQAKK